MATYAQLEREVWWGREFQPPSLKTLCERLRIFYKVSANALGSKGDNNHLRGYHRSRNWIKNSVFCTNRTYSVSRTPGDRSGGNGDWLAAVDATIPRAQLLATCQRLDQAVRAGHLEKITEWYGNRDGDTRVDGYDNIANAVATSDSSHLWHLHMSFDRGHVGDNHDDLYEILTGDTMPITPEDAARVIASDVAPGDERLSLGNAVWQTRAAVLKLVAPTPLPVDIPALVAALDPLLRKIVREELDKTGLGPA